MYYLEREGAEKDVVFSTRIRFARNLKDYPFASLLDPTSASEIVEKVVRAAGEHFTHIDLATTSPLVARQYLERHLISHDLLSVKVPHALLLDDQRDLAIMVCEEDHIRLQAFASGYDLMGAYKVARAADEALCEKLAIAFDERLGYLTHCPTNLGTGMRASVMLFLPALTASGQLSRLIPQLGKLSLTVRGLYGEGTKASGYLYQISNQNTLGETEMDTLARLGRAVDRLCQLEREARASLMRTSESALSDAAGRAYGICRYSAQMTSSELLSLWADLRLGVCLSLAPTPLSLTALDTLLFASMPASISLWAGLDADSERERDMARARLLREKLA